MAKLDLECQKKLVAGLFLFFGKMVAVKRMVRATRTENGKDSKGGDNGTKISTVSLSHQSFCKILAHS